MALFEMDDEYKELKKNAFFEVYVPPEHQGNLREEIKKYEYSYLENCLYAIRKTGYKEIVLTEAKSPLDAVLNVINWELI